VTTGATARRGQETGSRTTSPAPSASAPTAQATRRVSPEAPPYADGSLCGRLTVGLEVYGGEGKRGAVSGACDGDPPAACRRDDEVAREIAAGYPLVGLGEATRAVELLPNDSDPSVAAPHMPQDLGARSRATNAVGRNDDLIGPDLPRTVDAVVEEVAGCDPCTDPGDRGRTAIRRRRVRHVSRNTCRREQHCKGRQRDWMLTRIRARLDGRASSHPSVRRLLALRRSPMNSRTAGRYQIAVDQARVGGRLTIARRTRARCIQHRCNSRLV